MIDGPHPFSVNSTKKWIKNEGRIEKILNNPALLIKMSTAAKNFYKPDAAEKIAKDIISVIK